jgi:hypothetical protein
MRINYGILLLACAFAKASQPSPMIMETSLMNALVEKFGRKIAVPANLATTKANAIHTHSSSIQTPANAIVFQNVVKNLKYSTA